MTQFNEERRSFPGGMLLPVAICLRTHMNHCKALLHKSRERRSFYIQLALLLLSVCTHRNHRRALLRERQERKAEEKRLKEKLKAEGFSTEQLRLRLE
eukprot:scaffold107265_cov21-Tisochrysis_lutea.AAC.1